MNERMPKFLWANIHEGYDQMIVRFDRPLSAKQMAELREHIALKFHGQLRRDPHAKQTPPPSPEAG